jgi:hypothetical protein
MEHAHSMCVPRREKFQPFELDQNPNACHALQNFILQFGRDFWNNIPAEGNEIFCDVVYTLGNACVNGMKCKGTANLPPGTYRCGIFMCNKRMSSRNPDNLQLERGSRPSVKSRNARPECFERCMCLACAIHSMVRIPHPLIAKLRCKAHSQMF